MTHRCRSDRERARAEARARRQQRARAATRRRRLGRPKRITASRRECRPHSHTRAARRAGGPRTPETAAARRGSGRARRRRARDGDMRGREQNRSRVATRQDDEREHDGAVHERAPRLEERLRRHRRPQRRCERPEHKRSRGDQPQRLPAVADPCPRERARAQRPTLRAFPTTPRHPARTLLAPHREPARARAGLQRWEQAGAWRHSSRRHSSPLGG